MTARQRTHSQCCILHFPLPGGGVGTLASDYFVPFLDYGEDKFEEKRSKFTGRLWHVETPEQATAKIKEMRETYWDATHHCYAYILREGNVMRYSDDGEPQGTAGMPILDVLRHENLVDVCCVVTRYFGGVLLGTGGLVRAYTQGAQIAVAAAGVQRMSLYTVALIACPYNLYEIILHLLPDYDCSVEETDYGADVTLTVTLPAGTEDRLNEALAEATAGQVYAEVMETRFMGRRVK